MSAGEELADLGIRALSEGYASGELSPVDVVEGLLARVSRVEPAVQALYLLDPDQALAAAAESADRWSRGGQRGPLDGVPATVKDNIATAGDPVPVGSAGTELVPAAEDAPPAARLREAGAVLFAKTTMPDFGMLSSGLSSFHPLTRNPWNLAWNPGGSSAGAAAAAAAGYGPLHVGTDIGGSLRLPAGWTATVALKPSLGRIPIDPPYHGRVAGPITRTVEDAALAMTVLAQPDDRDGMSLPAERIDWSELSCEPRGLRIGVHLDAGCGLAVEPEITAAVRAAAEVFAAAGAELGEVTPFFSREMLDDLDLFWRVRGWVEFRALSEQRQTAVLPFIAEWCRGGAGVPGEVVMRCVNRKLEIRAAALAATRGFDYVISPVSPVPTYPAELPSPTDDPQRPLEHIAFTAPYNMSEQPALSINCGFTREGKPIGLQIAGRRFDDRGVLAVGRWFEGARGADAVPDWSAVFPGA